MESVSARQWIPSMSSGLQLSQIGSGKVVPAVKCDLIIGLYSEMKNTLSVGQLARELESSGHICPDLPFTSIDWPYERAPASLTEVVRHLKHQPRPRGPNEVPTDVWPAPDQIVTLACERDSCQPAEDRRHYYVVRTDPQSHEPLIAADPQFQMDVLDDPSIDADVRRMRPALVDGPMRWLLRRWQNERELYLWPSRRLAYWAATAWEIQELNEWVLTFEPTRDLIRSCRPHGEAFAVVVGTRSREELDLLAALGHLVGLTFRDFFVADSDFQLVYHLHHHDKVMVSCPDPQQHALLLSELSGRMDLIEDVSGFQDDEEEE